jgi:DNA-binding protein YbaB
MLPTDVRMTKEWVLSADLARLTAEFEKFQARVKQAEARFGGVDDMREQLTELAVVATSSDRTVKVTAGAGGSITDIELTQDAVLQPAPALAATINGQAGRTAFPAGRDESGRTHALRQDH